MTQKELAVKVGCHYMTISELERGVQEPAWPLVLACARALGVSCEALHDPAAPATPPEPAAPRGRPRKAAPATEDLDQPADQPGKTAREQPRSKRGTDQGSKTKSAIQSEDVEPPVGKAGGRAGKDRGKGA